MEKILQKNSKGRYALTGLISGLLNGFFGSGGGIAAVPMLRLSGLDAKQSHATSVAVIFFLTLVSAAGYMVGGTIDGELFTSVLPYLPAGAAGAFFGAVWLKNINTNALRRIFAALLVFSGVRMLMK